MFKKIFFLLHATFLLHAELLIFQQKPDGTFGLLSPENSVRHNDTIADIMMKYQWPMVINSDLKPEERIQLLAAEQPNAEENFIQKKLQEALPDLNLHVVFIPTTLYEMFVLSQQNLPDTPLKSTFAHMGDLSFIKVTNLNFCTQDDISHTEIQQLFLKNNAAFYKKIKSDKESTFIWINNSIILYLITHYPKITEQPSNTAISDFIKSHYPALSQKLSKKLSDSFLKLEPAQSKKAEYFKTTTKLINQIIFLDYQARENNKALLLRGNQFIKANINSREILVIGDTFDRTPNTVNRENVPASVSFGASLFAGFLKDQTASAFYMLYIQDRILQTSPEQLLKQLQTTQEIGYYLLINKLEYIHNNIMDLFFIPPLSTLAALFQKGECFHPRTKIPNQLLKHEIPELRGLAFRGQRAVNNILRSNVLASSFAKRFSNFLANNAKAIIASNENLVTNLNVASNQKALADYYRTAAAHDRIKEMFQRRQKPKDTFEPHEESQPQQISPIAKQPTKEEKLFADWKKKTDEIAKIYTTEEELFAALDEADEEFHKMLGF